MEPTCTTSKGKSVFVHYQSPTVEATMNAVVAAVMNDMRQSAEDYDTEVGPLKEIHVTFFENGEAIMSPKQLTTEELERYAMSFQTQISVRLVAASERCDVCPAAPICPLPQAVAYRNKT